MLLTVATAPATQALTLAEAKAHLRVDANTEDTLITSLIAAAGQWVEKQLGRQLVTATYDYSIAAIPLAGVVILPKAPLQAVASVKYIDQDGQEQTFSAGNYRAHADTTAGYIRFDSAPSTATRDDAITIRFTAGYGNAAAVPEPLKIAMLMMIGHWFANREAVTAGPAVEVPLGAERLLNLYRDMIFK